MTDEQELFTLPEVAKILGINVGALVYRLEAEKVEMATANKGGRLVRVISLEVASQFTERRHRPRAPKPLPSPEGQPKEKPTVIQVLASRKLSKDAHETLRDWALETNREWYRGLLSATAAARLIERDTGESLGV